ncbi:MAG: hypothetical protein HZA29_00790 [Candidatus Omnitrophica bacterium]|nr:hypothetical protein [Candidatus Omnitrophota bacterium]
MVMKNNGKFEGYAGACHQPFPRVFTSSANSVAVYTVLSILSRMKVRVGLEAMLEYLDRYLATVDSHNPELKQAVDKALGIVSVERLYREARK